MKSLALASQQISIAAILLGTNVCSSELTRRDLPLAVAYLNCTGPGYLAVCKPLYVHFAGLFGVIFYLIYAGECSFARFDILSDARGSCVAASNWPDCDMDINEEILRICENPLPATNYDVWKLKEKLEDNADYRSRRKGSSREENKLKPYEATAGKADTENKLKDRPIDYTCIDEYCKVSGPKPSDDSEDDNTRPRELITNTAFGHSKMPFVKFARHHVGGGNSDCTLTQPLAPQPARCHIVDPRIRKAEASYHRDGGAQATDYYETDDDITLKCCGGNVDTAVDYCTCMFCVKGLFYHCTKDSCPDSALEEPCSCTPVDTGCVKRWTALGVLAIFLPCLVCYPITRGCTEVCKCYKKQQASMKGRRGRTVQSRERLK